MKKARFLFVLIGILMAFFFVMDASYELGLLLCFFFLLIGINGACCLFSGRDMTMQIHLPYSSEKGEEFKGSLMVSSYSLFPVWKGFVKIVCENTMTGEKEEFGCAFGVWPKGEAKSQFALTADYCGNYRFRVEEVRVFDMFGIFSVKRKVQTENTVLIFPKTEPINLTINAKDAYDMESFRYSDVVKGDDSSETFAIREYMAGDSMRKIHWKLTGKLDTIMVKESSFPIFNSMMLLLETGHEGGSLPKPEQMDAAMEVFLSVAEMYIRREMPFEIGFYDYEKELFYSERIETLEELWNLVPGMLKAERKKAANSAWYQYQASSGDRRFAHYIYVAADGSFGEVELFAESEAITILRCGEIPYQDGRHFTYTANNWKEELM